MKLYANRPKTVQRRITVELDAETAAALDTIERQAKAAGQQMQIGAAVAEFLRRQVRAEVRSGSTLTSQDRNQSQSSE